MANRRKRRWTQKEINYLVRFYAYQPLSVTAKKLQRTKRGVKYKAADIGLHRYTESLTAKTLAQCFNSDVSVVIRWIEKFNLPCKKTFYNNQHRYFIDIDEFWKWAEQNKGLINWIKYDVESLPPDPLWVKEERAKMHNTKHRKTITIYDKQTVKSMDRQGFTNAQIAKELGRTVESIKHIKKSINRSVII